MRRGIGSVGQQLKLPLLRNPKHHVRIRNLDHQQPVDILQALAHFNRIFLSQRVEAQQRKRRRQHRRLSVGRDRVESNGLQELGEYPQILRIANVPPDME